MKASAAKQIEEGGKMQTNLCLLEACRTVLARVSGTNINTPIKDMADTLEILRAAVREAGGILRKPQTKLDLVKLAHKAVETSNEERI